MSTCLPCIEMTTGPIPTASVIWLHGLGASGDDFAAIVPELDLTACPAIRFVFPHAPTFAGPARRSRKRPAGGLTGVPQADLRSAAGSAR